MSDFEALQHQIDRLESRHAIAELVTAYAMACDDHDMPRLMSCFTDDAVFDTPSGAMIAEGRAAIESMFIETFKIRGPSFHWTHDHQVSFVADDPERASGVVLSHAETCPDGTVSLAAMRYYDEYRRVDSAWRFSRREIRFLYYVPVTDYPTILNKTDRTTIGGRQLPADHPESLPSWQNFHRQFIEPNES